VSGVYPSDGPILPIRPRSPVTEVEDREGALLDRIRRLEKINAALMGRVERSADAHGNAYSLFQTAINLEFQVRARTEELTQVLRRLEQSNDELRRAKDDAERSNDYKTRFLAAAGHDLLQPLNAARLSLSALAEVQTSDEGERITGQVDRALQTIEELLKTLLDISKLDAGVTQPEVRVVPLADVFASLASDFGPIVAHRGLALRIRPTSLFVRTDPLLLRRILQNLLSNAIRHTRAGGVVIGTRASGPDAARIVVADTGVGIPATEHEAIFEEFRRGSTRGPDGPAGLGLGLAIVRRMARALDHPIGLRSAVGRGSVFSVTVPTAPAPERVAPEETANAALKTFGIAEAKVLVVENDAAVLAATEHLLTRWGCRVVAVRDVAGANAAFDPGNPPDIVLADYHLDDDETGLSAILAVRSRFDRSVPAIVVTADISEQVADRLRAAGCEIMQKPVKPAELRALMAHLLG
jgi:signal transduction histidine kinase